MSASSPAFLVFGAYGGIGSALARQLHASGARLVLAGRDAERLRSIASEVDALPLVCDAADFSAVEEAVDAAVESLGRIDGIASCVGTVLLKPAHLTQPKEFLDTVSANLTSSFAILRAGVRSMMRQDGGSIVLVSTAAARVGLPNHDAIAAAKGGVDALVRSATATYGKAGIRINAVAPGLVETPLTERITGNARALEASEAMHALGRIGTAEEVAEAIRWLLSTDSGWVTGQTLGVDGGLGVARSA